jgi:adenine-specific DNA-methyltransferase
MPDAVVDVDGDLDALSRDELVALIEAQREAGVRISFAGKTNARQLARKVRPRVQRPIKKYSIGSPQQQAQNLLVEGDNLQSLVTLYKARGQVDLILTDPPYNTGKDFRYNDKWDEDPNDPGIGEFVSEDDAARHTKWMRFMLPRLRLMKAMLKPGGILAICIDQRELFHLGQMLDERELFEEKNRIAIINWERAATRRNDKGGGGVSTATEYVLVYAREKDKAKTGLEPRVEGGFRNPDNDPEGDWAGVGPWAPDAPGHRHMVYAVQSPFTGILHYPPGNQCWKLEKRSVKRIFEQWGSRYVERDLQDDKASALLLKGAKDPRTLEQPLDDPVVRAARTKALQVAEGVLPEIYFTKRGEGRPRRKTYESRVKKGMVPTTYWADDLYDEPLELGSTSWDNAESGTSEVGSRELSAVIGDAHGFETVKPLKLFQKIVQIWCPPNGLVLDPFAGSGTTGHAVLSLNATSDADRRFILIEQGRPEKGDSYARSLMAQRMQRVVTGEWASQPAAPLPGGFRFVTLDKKVDSEALLRMERDEMVDTVIASYFDASQRRGNGLVTIEDSPYRYLVAKNAADEGFFLIWDGADANTDFTEEVYEDCAEEACDEGLKSVYHVYARFNLYQTENVLFYQIPDRILADFGLDVRSEPFASDPA